MSRYVVRRAAAMITTLFAVAIAIFLLIRAAPGDIVDATLGGITSLVLTEEQLDELRVEYGLKEPLAVQFYQWFTRAIVGDLGTSWRSGKSVSHLILGSLDTTVELALLAVFLSVLLGIVTGVVSAIYQNTLVDHVTRVVAMASLAMPIFWQGTMIILVLSIYIGRLPSMAYVHFYEDPLGNLTIMTLPAISLGTGCAAGLMRLTRSGLLEVLRQEYIVTARAKGLHQRVILMRHSLKNALIPIMTSAGLQLGYLLGGTLVVEQVFALPGLGRLLLRGVTQRDYPVVQGCVLTVAFMFILSNFVVDLLYGYVDPRLRKA